MGEEQTFAGGNSSRFGTPWSTNYDIFVDRRSGRPTSADADSFADHDQPDQRIATGIFDGNHDFGGTRPDLAGPGLQPDIAVSRLLSCRITFPASRLPVPGRSSARHRTTLFPARPNLHDTMTDDWSWSARQTLFAGRIHHVPRNGAALLVAGYRPGVFHLHRIRHRQMHFPTICSDTQRPLAREAMACAPMHITNSPRRTSKRPGNSPTASRFPAACAILYALAQ